MKKRLVYAFIALFALPAFADDLGVRNQVKEGSLAVAGVGAADFAYNATRAVKAASPHYQRAMKYNDVTESFEQARSKLRENISPKLNEEIKAIDEELAKRPENAAKLRARRDQILGEIEARAAFDHRDRSFIRYRDQSEARTIKSFAEGNAELSRFRGRLLIGAGAVAAGAAVYELVKEEKIEQPIEAPASPDEAKVSESEEIPNHIAAKLDAMEENPF